MDLFLTKPKLTFEKQAASAKTAAVQLDEDVEAWPRQILTELFRSEPTTSEYTPRVSMLKMDEEQGFGLGVVVIENVTDSALAITRMSPVGHRVLVPIVIRNHMLDPLDIIMLRNGKLLPMNANRLREALFRPDTFEQITEDWGDTTLYNMFYPPGRSDNDFGAGISQGIGGGTQGAVTFIQGPGMKLSADGEFLLLKSALSVVLAHDVEKVKQALKQDRSIMANCSEATLAGLSLIADSEKVAASDASSLMRTALDVMPTSVVQLGWSSAEDAYWVKKASRTAYYAPKTEWKSRGEMLKLCGEEVVQKIDTEGTVTVSPEPAQVQEVDADASKWSEVDKAGIYKVKTVHGKEMTGWVLPNLIDLDGDRVPMAVFTNGAAAMVQGSIVGAHVAQAVDLPATAPKGTGCFYMAGQGGIECTVPVLVQGAESLQGGDSYLVRSLTGEESRVRVVPGLKSMVVLKGEFHVPATAKFLPLSEETMVPLIDSVAGVTKTSADMLAPKAILSGGDEDGVRIRFEGLPKLASTTPPKISIDEATFLLCLAGATAKTAQDYMAKAKVGHTVTVHRLVDVRLASDILNQTRKVAADRSREVAALRRDLVKEAAVLPNVMTADAILSLGFINSENVRMYVSRIPYLEKCLSMVCELLLGARVGLTEVPEFAAARCTRALDEVIQGLKALALRDVQEGSPTGS